MAHGAEGDVSLTTKVATNAAVYVTGRFGHNPCKLDGEGKLIWCYESEATKTDDGRTRADHLAIDAKGSVYTASSTTRKLCKIDDGGNLLWCTDTKYHPVALAADVDGGVFVATLARGRHTDNPLLCRFDDEGREDWCISNGEQPIVDLAVDASGHVYVGASSHESMSDGLCKYERDGSKVWCSHRHEGSSGGSRLSGLAVHPDGAVYTAGADGKACKWDEMGLRVWCVEDFPLLAPSDIAVTADGRARVVSRDGVCAFDTDGQKQWCYEPDSPVIDGLVVNPDGDVYYTTIVNSDLCKVDSAGDKMWCKEPIEFISQQGLKMAVAPGPPGAFSQVLDPEAPSEKFEYSFAEAASSKDGAPLWMTLPAPPQWEFDIPDVVSRFKESASCYAHSSGLRVCLQRREPGSSSYESYVLFGDEDDLFLITCGGYSRVGDVQRCSFSDQHLSPRHLPFEESNFDREARKERADGSERKLPPASNPGFEMWADPNLRRTSQQETGEQAGGADLVRLDCGAEIDFVPLSSTRSADLIDNAQLRWPLPTSSFQGGKTDEGQLVAAVQQRVAGGERQLGLYVGNPPALEEVPIEKMDIYRDGGSRHYSLADGGSFFLPNPMHNPMAEEAPDRTGTLRMTEDAKEQSVQRLSSQELQEIFSEEVTSPKVSLPDQSEDRPKACTLLQRALDSP